MSQILSSRIGFNSSTYRTTTDSPPEDDREFWPWFNKFRRAVRDAVAAYSVRQSRGRELGITKAMSLPPNYKEEIHDLLNRIRKIVNATDLSDDKKDAIYDRISKLQAEIDRSRTRFDALLSLWLDLTNAIGQGAENLEPAERLMGRVMKHLGLAKSEHDQGKLEPPKEVKKLPAPTDDEPSTKSVDEDEIPF